MDDSMQGLLPPLCSLQLVSELIYLLYRNIGFDRRSVYRRSVYRNIGFDRASSLPAICRRKSSRCEPRRRNAQAALLTID